MSWTDPGPVLSVVVAATWSFMTLDVAPAWPAEGTAGEGELAATGPGISAKDQAGSTRAQKSLNSMLSKKATASTMAPSCMRRYQV
jgi:hypothetical protein